MVPRKGPKDADAAAIRRRLAALVKEVYGDDRRMLERMLKLQRTTVNGWKDRSVPEVAHLIKLGRTGQCSLNWLLLGEGPMLRQPGVPSQLPSEQLRGLLAAAFAATEGASPDEMERVLSPESLWTLVTATVRPLVQQRLALEREIAALKAGRLPSGLYYRVVTKLERRRRAQ